MISLLLALGAAGAVVSQAVATGLVGHWELDDAATPAVDAVGAAGNGTWSGSPTPSATVPGAIAAFSTGSLAFDPTNGDDYVELPNTAALENVQENDFTFMAWYRPAVVPPNTDAVAIPPAVDPTYNDSAQTLIGKSGWHCALFYTSDQKFVFENWLNNPADQWGPVWMGTGTWTTTYPPNAWYHVAGVWDKAAGETRIYVNGAPVWTTGWTATNAAYGPGSATREYGTGPWRIGIANPGGGHKWPAHGLIDDARIYNRELSDAEILAIAQGTDVGASTPPAPSPPPPPPPPPPAPRTSGDNDEGLFGDRCSCGSTIPAPWIPGVLALLAALALVRRR